MRRKNKMVILAQMFLASTVLAAGCGNNKETVSPAPIEEPTAVTELSENKNDTEPETDRQEIEEKDEKEPAKSEPASLYFLTKDKYIEEILDEYAVNIMDQNFTGDIGEKIPAYKDIDLDGDGISDVIERFGDQAQGCGYRIDFSAGGRIETDRYSFSPNEGEIIEFYDIDQNGTDEILITHITGSTGGPSCWQTSFYAKNDAGEWQGFWIIDNKSALFCKALEDRILERTGLSYQEQSVRFADVEMTEDGIVMLVDFGKKEGPVQTLDLEGVLFTPDFEKIKNGSAIDENALLYKDSSKEYVAKYWPLEAEGAFESENAVDDQSEELQSDHTEEETIPEYLVYVKASDGYANMRKGPGTEYDIICQIPNDESLEVYREDATDQNGSKWLKVAYCTKQNDGSDPWITGWIAESQLE